MSELETAVTTDAGPATAETTTTPDSTSSAAAPDSAPSSTPAPSSASRTYSDADVQRIVRERLASQKSSYDKRLSEFERKEKERDAIIARANAGIEGMARGFGFIKDEPPKPWETDIKSLEDKYEQRFKGYETQMVQREMMSRITNHWDVVKKAHSKYADLPGFKQAFADAWKPDEDPLTTVKPIISAYEKIFAANSNVVAEEKERAARTVPVGKGGGATSAPSDKDKGGPLRQRLRSALRASREG